MEKETILQRLKRKERECKQTLNQYEQEYEQAKKDLKQKEEAYKKAKTHKNRTYRLLRESREELRLASQRVTQKPYSVRYATKKKPSRAFEWLQEEVRE